jgi:hypothetical protein
LPEIVTSTTIGGVEVDEEALVEEVLADDGGSVPFAGSPAPVAVRVPVKEKVKLPGGPVRVRVKLPLNEVEVRLDVEVETGAEEVVDVVAPLVAVVDDVVTVLVAVVTVVVDEPVVVRSESGIVMLKAVGVSGSISPT